MCAVPFKQLVGTVLVSKDLLLEAAGFPLPGSLSKAWKFITLAPSLASVMDYKFRKQPHF